MTDEYFKNLPKFEADKKLMQRSYFLVEEWVRIYGKVDVREQIKWAHSWLVTSGKKYTDMGRFINNWLRSAQQRALEGKPGPVHKPYVENKPKVEEIMDESDWQRLRERVRRA